MSLPASFATLHGGSRIDRYEVLDLLGAGGFGAVYRARHVHTGQLVALKVLRTIARSNANAWEGLLREAKAMAQIGHPNVVRVYDAGAGADGTPFLVTELVEGFDLIKCIEREGRPLAPGRAIDLIWQVLDALSAAHARGIVHRDVKPANILVTSSRAADGSVRERALLLDFGISKLRDSEWAKTQPGLAMGTPGFMAPEQFANAASADARSDIYAAGATLYFLLSGRLPFEGNSGESLIASMLASPNAIPLRSVAPHLPASLCAVVDRALAKSPNDRWPDAQSFGIALQSVEKEARAMTEAIGSAATMAVDSSTFGSGPTTARPAASVAPSAHDAHRGPPMGLNPASQHPPSMNQYQAPPQHPSAASPPAAMAAIASSASHALAPVPSFQSVAPVMAATAAPAPAAQRTRSPWYVGGLVLVTAIGSGAYWLGASRQPAEQPVAPPQPQVAYIPIPTPMPTQFPTIPTMPAVVPGMPATPTSPTNSANTANTNTAPMPGLDPDDQNALQMAAQMMALQNQAAANPSSVGPNVPGLTPQQRAALQMAAQMMAQQQGRANAHSRGSESSAPRTFGSTMPGGSFLFADGAVTFTLGMTAAESPTAALQELAHAAAPLIAACPRSAPSAWTATFSITYQPNGAPALRFFGGQPNDSEATCALTALQRSMPTSLGHRAGANILMVQRAAP